MTPVYTAFAIDKPYGRVDVVLSVYKVDGVGLVCGLRRMEGKINLPPKALRAAAKQEIAIIEQIAKEAGCAEIRHIGPGWSRILDDYEPITGVPHGLRKRLT